MKEVDYSKYLGEWVIECDNKVIAHDADLRKIADKIEKCKSTPILTKVPSGDSFFL